MLKICSLALAWHSRRTIRAKRELTVADQIPESESPCVLYKIEERGGSILRTKVFWSVGERCWIILPSGSLIPWSIPQISFADSQTRNQSGGGYEKITRLHKQFSISQPFISLTALHQSPSTTLVTIVGLSKFKHMDLLPSYLVLLSDWKNTSSFLHKCVLLVNGDGSKMSLRDPSP